MNVGALVGGPSGDPFTETKPDGTVRLTKHDGSVPLLYSVKATKPA